MHPLINASNIYVRSSIACHDNGVTYHTSTSTGAHTCHLDMMRKCLTMTYELPTSDNEFARLEAEKGVEAKERQIEGHANRVCMLRRCKLDATASWASSAAESSCWKP